MVVVGEYEKFYSKNFIRKKIFDKLLRKTFFEKLFSKKHFRKFFSEKFFSKIFFRNFFFENCLWKVFFEKLFSNNFFRKFWRHGEKMKNRKRTGVFSQVKGHGEFLDGKTQKKHPKTSQKIIIKKNSGTRKEFFSEPNLAHNLLPRPV